MGMFEKLAVLADRTYQQQVVLPSYHDCQTEVFRHKFGASFPSLTEIAKQSSQIFVNSHPLLELGRPYSHKVHQIGGITLKEKGKLSEEFDKILSERLKGAIVFSFGSLAKTDQIPLEIRMAFAKSFNNFPEYTVIWKYDGDDTSFLANYTNIVPVKWIQQVELLSEDFTTTTNLYVFRFQTTPEWNSSSPTRVSIPSSNPPILERQFSRSPSFWIKTTTPTSSKAGGSDFDWIKRKLPSHLWRRQFKQF